MILPSTQYGLWYYGFFLFLCILLPFFYQKPNAGLGCLIVEVSMSHTDTHTSVKTPLKEWSARRRGRCLQNTYQTREMNIMPSTGFETADSSNQAAADLSLR